VNIFVGNLAWEVSDDDLLEAFAAHGSVDSARVIRDRLSGRSRGFGFVEMSNTTEAEAAIGELKRRASRGGRSRSTRRGRAKNEAEAAVAMAMAVAVATSAGNAPAAGRDGASSPRAAGSPANEIRFDA
jgi:RNA recognition motif-containing protein